MFGHHHRGQLGQAVPLGGEELEAQLRQPVLQQPSARRMAAPGLLQALVEEGPEPGVSAPIIVTGAVWW